MKTPSLQNNDATSLDVELEDQTKTYATMVRDILDLLKQAKVDDVAHLIGIPVECTFDGMQLKSFRVLTEVL